MRRYLLILFACLIAATAFAAGDKKDAAGNRAGEEQQDEQQPPRADAPLDTHYDGIDVSDHQKRIDWARVARDKKVKYVYIKATEGATYVSSLYRENLEQARKHGIKVGSYHFLRTGSRIQEQFDNFKNTVKKHEQDLLPLIDIEVRQGWTTQQLRDSLKLFADLVEEHYGCRPMIYTSSSFYDNFLGRAFNIYPLFIARYSAAEPSLKSGNDWVMWQFSEKGHIDGIGPCVDLSRFNKGRSLADITIAGNRLQRRNRSTAEMVDRNREKPENVQIKEAPKMSKKQEQELKKKQEKERKAQERAQKLAQDEQKKQEEAKRLQQERQQKAQQQKQHEEQLLKEKQLKEQERLRKQRQEQQEREKAQKLKAERERLQLEQAKAKEQKLIEEQAEQERLKQEKAEQRRKWIEQREKAKQQQSQPEQNQQNAQQEKKQQQLNKLQQQKQQSQNQSKARAVAPSSQPSAKKTNKSSADND